MPTKEENLAALAEHVEAKEWGRSPRTEEEKIARAQVLIAKAQDPAEASKPDLFEALSASVLDLQARVALLEKK